MPQPAPVQPENPGPPKGSRTLFSIWTLPVTLRHLAIGLLVFALLASAGLWSSKVDLGWLHAHARRLPAAGVIAAIAVLPLTGFPITWLHLAAGVRFSLPLGIAVVAVTSVIQHLLAWGLVRILPAAWFHRFAPWRHQLARTGHREATLLCCLMPGVPFVGQLYLLPLLGTPWPLMLGLSSLIHTLRAVVTLRLGDIGDHPTPGQLALVAAYYFILFGLSAWSVRRIQRSLAAAPAA
ncbi:MAG: hypothetical protein ACKV19_28020 [Verrucomicrobiales bacterium]